MKTPPSARRCTSRFRSSLKLLIQNILIPLPSHFELSLRGKAVRIARRKPDGVHGFLAGILLLPVLIDGVRNSGEPLTVFGEFQNFHCGEKFDAIHRRVAEWLQKTRRN